MSVIRGILVILSVVGFCIPQPAWAINGNIKHNSLMTDVSLHNDGLLLGQVVNHEGKGLPSVSVTLRDGTQALGTVQTDDQGYFTFRGVTSSVYQIATPEGFAAYRVWTSHTAPPSAQPGALVVVGDGVVRGNAGSRFASFITNPWVLLGIVTTAIAVPVAIEASDNPSSP